MPLSQAPRAHRDPAFLAAKRARLREPHVAPLNDLAERIAAETGLAVPAFDPDSAGVRARALFLFEAPGARSTGTTGPRAAAKGSGIISPDNNDGTAENMWRLHQAAGLPRTATLAWNIVPWYVGSEARIRAVERSDLAAAAPYLAALIRLLPDLRVVVTFGDKPRRGWFRYLLRDDAPLLPTLAVPHPSPLSLNPHPENRELIVRALRRVADTAGLVPTEAQRQAAEEEHDARMAARLQETVRLPDSEFSRYRPSRGSAETLAALRADALTRPWHAGW